jgi:hypothetical protein
MPENHSTQTRNRRNFVLAVVFVFLPLIWMVPSYIALSRHADTTNLTCQAHMKRIGQALQTYAAAHNDQLPDAAHWVDELLPMIGDAGVLRCPADKTAGRSSYAFNAKLSGRKLNELPRETVLLYETAQAGAKPSGSGADVISLGEKDLVTGSDLLGGRHNGMGYRFNYYLFADGTIHHPTYTTDLEKYRW